MARTTTRSRTKSGSKTCAPDAAPLEEAMGYHFADRALLQLALTHRSYVFETPGAPDETNERLEFLGDAILAAVTAEYLYRTFPDLAEGELTDVRAALVKAPTLAGFARTLGLGACLRMGKGEERTGGRDREPLLAAGFEALVGALLLESGMEQAAPFILRFIMPAAQEFVAGRRFKDDKSAFQQLAQARLGLTPSYVIVETTGPAHHPLYRVEVRVGNLVAGRGMGSSKQRAEQEAARDALAQEGWQVDTSIGGLSS